MEDAHAAVLEYNTEDAKERDTKDRLSFFGVYDGHGGDKVAIYAGDNLHKIIAKQQSFKEGRLDQALKDGFLATDRAILSGTEHPSCISESGILSLTHNRRSEI
jgi:protein phosphatase PTC2/3